MRRKANMRVFTVILGGGPAGCAAAIQLALAGQEVAILERSQYETQRVGEVLPPGAIPRLHRLGVWDTFDSYLPSPGIVSVWGNPQPYENDFIFHPYGKGWHLDRRRFDESLAGLACAAGATLHCGVLRNFLFTSL